MSVREEPGVRVAGEQLCGLAWLGGLLWYSDAGLEQIIAVDPESGAEERRLPCPGVRTGLTAAGAGTRLVQVVGADKRLRALDPESGETIEEQANPRPGGELCGLHDTADGLWFGYQRPPVLDLRRHGDLEPVVTIPVDQDVADMTAVDGLVVFANNDDARLNVVDPGTGAIVRVISVAGSPTGLTWDGSRFWYCDYGAGHLRSVAADLVELVAAA